MGLSETDMVSVQLLREVSLQRTPSATARAVVLAVAEQAAGNDQDVVLGDFWWFFSRSHPGELD